MKTDSEILIEAAGTGQLLTVIYQGGRAPGFKRRILIRSVEDDEMQVREFPAETPKTYLVSRTTVVGNDHPAPWLPEDAGRVTAVVPETYFSEWAYFIPPHFYSALGVNVRYVIDQDKTKPARDEAIALGMDRKEATKRIKIMRREDAVSSPPSYDFHEGDLFYRRDSAAWFQIVKIRTANEQVGIEGHIPCSVGRKVFILSVDEVAHVLKTGKPPVPAKQIPASMSDSESLRLMIEQPV
jgi:hypothetical protein